MTTLPLDGYTVADFTQVWAGPQLAGVLADMGARVIRVDSMAGTDAMRQTGASGDPLMVRLRSLWLYRNREYYVTLNLAEARAVELAKEIVRRSDVVLENYSPRVMRRFGLDYEELRKVKKDIIMLSMSAGGQTGPYSDLLGYGPSINAVAGTDSLVGYEGEGQLMANIWDPDPTIATMGCFAVLAALYHKKQTGKGQYIDLSFYETLASLLGEGFMEYQMTGIVPGPRGTWHPDMAPHGFFPCKGEDSWVSIAVKTEAEWQALLLVMGDPRWARSRRFADIPSRLRHREELEKRVAEWTAERDSWDVTTALQQAGVAAHPVLSVADLFHDPHDTHRRTSIRVELPTEETPEIPYGIPWRLSDTPGSVRRAAPPMGADNERFFTQILGLSVEEVRQLQKGQVIY